MKTMGIELAEQLGWRLPNVIVYPTGGGEGTIGIWKAFAELGEDVKNKLSHRAKALAKLKSFFTTK